MKSQTIFIILTVLVALVIAACAPITPVAAPPAAPQTAATAAPAAPEATTAPAASSDCTEDIYVVTAPLVHPFLNVGEQAAYDAGKDLGVKVLYFTPTEFNMPKQLEMTEAALSIPCVVGLGLIAADPNLFDGVLQQAVDKGLAVAQQSACKPETPAPICFSGDLFAAGQAVGERLAKELGGKGNVVVAFGDIGDVNHQRRVDGLQDYFTKNAPDMKIIDTVVSCNSPDTSVTCAETALAAHPEMNAYYSTGSNNATGAFTVFPAAGRDDILIATVDDEPETIQAIKDGRNVITYAQQKYGLGYWLVYLPWVMHTKGVKPSTNFVDTRITFVDKTNVDTYEDVVKQNFTEVTKEIDKVFE